MAKINYGFNPLWPTEVLYGNTKNKEALDNACQTLFQEINFSSPRSEFLKFEHDLLNDGPPEMQVFRDEVVWPAFEEYLNNIGISLKDFPQRRIKSWVTGVLHGYMIPYHNHCGASLSSVFYMIIDNDKRPAGGELLLFDPRNNANRGYKEEFYKMFESKSIHPENGDYVIFPGFLYHQSTPFNGSIRLAMPVDLFL
jgi:hypothetical protein